MFPIIAFTAPLTVAYMSTSFIQISAMLSKVSLLVTSYAAVEQISVKSPAFQNDYIVVVRCAIG